VLFKPSGCPALLAANDKNGELIVWRQDGLGKGPYARIPLSDGDDAFVGAPSWSPITQMLYDSTATALKAGTRLEGTVGLKVTATCGFTKRWFAATGDGSQPEPLVAGDLVADTGGSKGGFVVERAATGVVVWRFATAAATLSPLIEVGNTLIGGDMSGRLYAFRPTR
jgi:outer membrane protein assembly factor BamB